ncbi:MAG: hypothetical protein QXU54_00245 [Candidatus Micrarchaeia archaeon]
MRQQFLLLLLLGSVWACVDLSEPGTWAGNIVNVSPSNKSFYVVNNTTLCRQDITIPTVHPLFIVNQSNTVIDLNGSTLRGTGLGNGVLSRYNGTVIRNGVFRDFSNAIGIFDIDENNRDLYWSYSENPGSTADAANIAFVDPDGNYIVGGYESSSGNNAWFVKKFSPDGDQIFNFSYNPSTLSDILFGGCVDSAENYIFSGGDTSTGNMQWRIMKLSADGSTLWSRAYDISSGNDYAASIAVDGDGNYVAAGIDRVPGNFQMRVMKISPSGDSIWNWTLNPSSGQDYLTAVAVDPAGDYIVGGYDNTPGNAQWRVVKISPNGTALWNWTQNPSAGFDALNYITVDLEGSYVAVGYDYSLGNAQWRVVKISPNGTALWNWTQNPSAGFDSLTSVAIDEDGNYIILGYDFVLGYMRPVLLAISPNGNLLWQFSVNTGGAGLLSSVVVDSEGNYLVCGYDSIPGNAELFIAKIGTEKNALSGILLQDISIYDSNMSTFLSLPNADATANNLTLGYNEEVGVLQYESLVSIDNAVSNSYGVLLRPNFISVNSGSIPSFDAPASIILYAPLCTDRSVYTTYKGPGFPRSSSEIISYDEVYIPLSSECRSPTSFMFEVGSFSGYALSYGGCIDLSDNRTWAENKVHAIGNGSMLHILRNITLCRQDITIPTVHPLFIVNQSNTVIDLNGSTLRGTGLGKGVLSRYNGTAIRNGVFDNFGNAISIYDIDDGSPTVDFKLNFTDGAIFSVDVDQDGNYVIGGAYNFSSGNPGLYVAKMLPNGSIVWEWKRGPSGAQNSILDVAIDQDGSCIAVGFDSASGSQRMFAVKLYANGSEGWTWGKDISPNADYATSVAVDRDGNYILAGMDYLSGRYGMRAIKLSSSGSELWNWSFIGPLGNYEAYDVAVDSDNNYMIVGSGYNSSLGNYEMRAVKLSGGGDTLFNVTINPTAGYNILYSVAVDQDGNYVCVGVADDEGVLVKLYPNGSLIYMGSYDVMAGDEQLVSVAVDQDNNYVLGGDGWSSSGNNEWFIIKTLKNGRELFSSPQNFAPDDDFISKVAVDFNGDIIAVGDGTDSSSQFMEVLKLKTNKHSLSGVLLSNVSIYDSNMSTFLALPSANAELINTIVGYNETAGKVRYSSVPAAGGLLANNMTILLRPEFVSLDETQVPSFSTNAEITLYVPNCSTPNKYAVYRLAGFPQSRDEIIATGSVYSSTSKVCQSESLLAFGVTSFSGYSLNETIDAPQPPSGGSGGTSRRHLLRVAPIEKQYVRVNEPLLLQVTIENTGDYTERKISVGLEPQDYIVAANSTIYSLESGYSANSSIAITGLKPGEYLLRIIVSSESGAGDEAGLELSVLPQCSSDFQCKSDEYCDEGVCSKLKCEKGRIENNRCVYYECIMDSDCSGGGRCIEHKCIEINCSRFEKIVANECQPLKAEIGLSASSVTVGDDFVVFVLIDGVKTAGVPLLVKYPDGSIERIISEPEGARVRALNAGIYVFSIEELPEHTKKAYAYELPAITPEPVSETVSTQVQTPQPKCCLIGICLELFGVCWYYWVFAAIATLVVLRLVLKQNKKLQKSRKY